MPDPEARDKRVRELCHGWPDMVLEVAGVPDAFMEAMKMVRAGGRVIEVGNISAGLKVSIPPSMITFKSLEIIGVATYPPHYLKKSLDFLATHMDRYPYGELCDATFPLSRAGEALDRSERREITRAGLLTASGVSGSIGSGTVRDQRGGRHQLGSIARHPPVELDPRVPGQVALCNLNRMPSCDQIHQAGSMRTIHLPGVRNHHVAIDREPSGVVGVDREPVDAGARRDKLARP